MILKSFLTNTHNVSLRVCYTALTHTHTHTQAAVLVGSYRGWVLSWACSGEVEFSVLDLQAKHCNILRCVSVCVSVCVCVCVCVCVQLRSEGFRWASWGMWPFLSSVRRRQHKSTAGCVCVVVTKQQEQNHFWADFRWNVRRNVDTSEAENNQNKIICTKTLWPNNSVEVFTYVAKYCSMLVVVTFTLQIKNPEATTGSKTVTSF